MSTSVDGLLADIIARIEAGAPPWRKPWQVLATPGLPLRSNGEPFTGSNAWTLAFIGALKGYTSPYWFTFRQALNLGAPVRKGEKAATAILYKTKVCESDGDGADESDPKVLRFVRGYSVFNAEQLQDCPERFLIAPKVDPDIRAAAQDAVLDAVPAQIRIGGLRGLLHPPSGSCAATSPRGLSEPRRFQSDQGSRAYPLDRSSQPPEP